MWRRLLAAAAALLLALVGTQSTSAQSTRVCADGCDHTTIQAAINAAAAGDVVLVAAGTYRENIVVNKYLEIQGQGSDSIVQSPGGTAFTYTALGSGTSASNRAYLRNVKISGSVKGLYADQLVNYLTLEGVTFDGNSSYAIHVNNISGAMNSWAIENSIFNANSSAIYISTQANLNGLSVTESTFTNQVNSAIYVGQSSSNPGGLNDVTLTGNTFTNNASNSNNGAAIYIEKLSNATISNNSFTNNGLNTNPRGIIINLKYGTYNTALLTNNIITESRAAIQTNGYGIDVQGRNDAPHYNAFPGTLTNLTLSANQITGFYRGIAVENAVDWNTTTVSNNLLTNSPYGILGVVYGTGNTANRSTILGLNNNSIVGSTLAAVANLNPNGGTIDATCNWYGTHVGPAAGQVAGPVTSIPYLINGTDGDSAIGFQPSGACVGGPVQVFADSSATTPQSGHATIQAAIDASTTVAGNEIRVGAGTYAETVFINKGVTVKSAAGAASTTIVGAATDANGPWAVRFGADNVRLEGFTVNNLNAANGRAIAPAGHAGGAIVNNTIINAFRGIQGDFYGQPTNLTIQGNTFETTVQYGIAGTEGMAGLVIAENTFKTSVEGIGLGAGAGIVSGEATEGLHGTQTWQLSGGYAIRDYRNNTTYVTAGGSIQRAIDASEAGGTVLVFAGTYLETIHLNKANLTLRSTGGAAVTTIRGGGGEGAADAVVRLGANGVTVNGFTIDRNNAPANSRAIAPMASNGATIVNNTITNAFRGIQGDFYGQPTNLTIQGNTFETTVQYGIAGTEGMAGLSISGNTFRTTVEGIGLGVGVGLAVTVDELFDAQTWQLPQGYAIKDYRDASQPIVGSPYLAIPTGLPIAQEAQNSGQPAGVDLNATLPILLYTNSHAINAATFSIAGSSCFNVAGNNPTTAVQLASEQPAGTTLGATVNPVDGALDIVVYAPMNGSLSNGPLITVQVNYNSSSSCLNPADGSTAVSFVAEQTSFGSTQGGDLIAGPGQNGSLRPRWGDCNGDSSVNAADISACILEIFDRDGTNRSAARYGTAANNFPGTIWCDSNQDVHINAGDIVCTVRRINALTCSTTVAASGLAEASVSVASAVLSEQTAQADLSLNAGGAAAAAFFVLSIDPAYSFDATDYDGNGLPDALQLTIPADYQAVADYNHDTRLLQLMVASLNVSAAPLNDGTLGTIILTHAGATAEPISIQEVSVGGANGESLPVQGLVVETPVEVQPELNNRLYLPTVTR